MAMGQSVELGSLTHKQPLPGTSVLCSPQVQTVSVLLGCSFKWVLPATKSLGCRLVPSENDTQQLMSLSR